MFAVVAQSLGAAVLALSFGSGGLALWSGWRRGRAQRQQCRHERESFRKRISAAKENSGHPKSHGSAWIGNRKFCVEQVVVECQNVCSFYLRPQDRKPLPGFLPGQYLTFDLEVPGQAKRVVRCYSLSDRPREHRYRVTIKRQVPPPDQPGVPPGLVSNFFHEFIKPGHVLDVKAPSGGFVLELEHGRPVVLISGGVGITPMVSMLNEIVETNCARETWFFHSARSRDDHIMKEHLEKIAAQFAHTRLHVCYSAPAPGDVLGKDYHHHSRVTVELLEKTLPSLDCHYFVCGPGAMMESIYGGLLKRGVPEQNIHMEAFGPASVKKQKAAAVVTETALGTKVTFARSNQRAMWTTRSGSLLDLAEAAGIAIDSGCRAGNCGTCKTAMKSGRVKYLKTAGCDVESGSCLPCICVPETAVMLDV